MNNYIQIGCHAYIFDTIRVINNEGFVPVLMKININ